MSREKNFLETIGKDKFILMAAAGVVLLICSFSEGDNGQKEEKVYQITETTISQSMEETDYVEDMEKRLCNLLKNIEGVGEVHVMITLKSTQQKEILKDISQSYGNTQEAGNSGIEQKIESESRDEKTVYGINSQGEEVPFVLGENMPEVEGVAVVADGAVKIEIKEKIINLIKALFGVGVNKIMVTG